MLLLSRSERTWQDRMFGELPEILRGDELIVVNNARVIPARLFGRRRGDKSEPPGKQSRHVPEYLSAEIEVLLTRNIQGDTWEALVRPGKKIRVGEHILFGEGALEAEVIERGELGIRHLKFRVATGGDGTVREMIERL